MSFSWGSSNNNTSSATTNNNASSFGWGSNNNNNNNTNNNNQSSNNNQTSNGSFSWGNSNTNNNNNSSNNQNSNANQNTSFAWGQNNTNNTNNNNGNTSREGWSNNNTTNNNTSSFGNNTSSFGANNNSSFGNNNNSATLNPNNDYVLPNTPNDAISGVQFHPNKPQFIVSSWDNSISYYEFFGNNQCKQLAQQRHPKPVLACCFDQSGDNVLSAGCDNVVKIWNVQQNKFATLGQHQAPIRCMQYNAGANFAISGSWDRKVSFWDTRSVGNNNSNAMHTIDVGHKIYAMATKSYHLVVGLSNNDILTYDLRNGARQIHSIHQEAGKHPKTVQLKKQIRCIDIFPDNGGYVAASIGGRVIIRHFDRVNTKDRNGKEKDFSYKCHRQNTGGSGINIFAVNVIKFHPQSGVFATGGDDGDIVTWDKDGRAKLFSFKSMMMNGYKSNDQHIDASRMPIVACDYHSNGQYMIYATSYNWNKGAEFNNVQAQKPHIYLHQVTPQELDKSKKK